MGSFGEGHDPTGVLDILPQGLLILDSQWVIRSVNQAAGRILGIACDKLPGVMFWDIAERFPREFIDKIRSGQTLDVPEEYESDGSCIELSLTVLQGGTQAIQLRENHEKALNRERAAREQAEAASAEIKSVLERIGDAYIAFDTEWRYTYVNWRAAELAQKPASELIGRCVWDEFPEAVKTPFFTELHRAMRDQTHVEFDNYFEPLGRWFENSVYPSPSGVGVYYRDITERVRTQRALERQTTELARKNSELEMFAYVASHDLQEPLRMVGAYAALLARKYSGVIDREADEFIQFIVGGVDRLQRLIKALLMLCRLEQDGTLVYSDVNSGEILDLACGNLELLIEDTGASVMRGELPVVRVEEMQFVQLMQNLIGNALKYRQGTPCISVGARREGPAWVFSIADNGIGFDPDQAQQIFLPFKRLQKRDDSGSGIGLAICKKIVESRGGRIWAESSPGAGSTFFFTIPDAVPIRD